MNVNRFHFWNETVGICQYKHEHLTEWLVKNQTNTTDFISKHYINIVLNFYKFVAHKTHLVFKT